MLVETKLGTEKAKYKKENTQSKLDQEGYQVGVEVIAGSGRRRIRRWPLVLRKGHTQSTGRKEAESPGSWKWVC